MAQRKRYLTLGELLADVVSEYGARHNELAVWDLAVAAWRARLDPGSDPMTALQEEARWASLFRLAEEREAEWEQLRYEERPSRDMPEWTTVSPSQHSWVKPLRRACQRGAKLACAWFEAAEYAEEIEYDRAVAAYEAYMESRY